MSKKKELNIRNDLVKIINKIESNQQNKQISSENHVILKTLRRLITEYEQIETDARANNQQVSCKSRFVRYARPSFLYVIYAVILSSIPFSLIFTFFDESYSNNIIDNLKGWLGAIPAELWRLFIFAYLGYAGARSIDKYTLLKSNQTKK